MVVHFTASKNSVDKDFQTLSKVIRVVHQTGNVLARDWMESQYYAKTVKELDSKHVYDLNIDAIERADLIIIENSFKSFGSGFQAAVALQKKKPVLMLINTLLIEGESQIAQGIRDPLLSRVEYSNYDELEAAVRRFIEDNRIKTKDLRFNFVLDPQLYNHIRWKSFKTKKTKAEVVRELLIQDMEKD